MMAGEGVAGVLDGGLDPVLALPDGHVGKADGRKQRKTGGEIDLDRDGMGIDADDGGADGLDDQGNTPLAALKNPYACPQDLFLSVIWANCNELDSGQFT